MVTEGEGTEWRAQQVEVTCVVTDGNWVFGGAERAVWLEKDMATHSSILAWRIPWTEGPGGLQSLASQRDGHYWATEHTHVHGRNMML